MIVLEHRLALLTILTCFNIDTLILCHKSESHSYEGAAPKVDIVIPPAAAGETKYNEILKLSENPKYGNCWTNALSQLENSCRSMREQQQQLLALSFTNCHLLMSGKNQLTCYTEEEASDCTSRMSDLAFNIYTSFFTHSENLCFFIQAQLWQEWQAKTVQQLADTTGQVVQTLDSTLEKQKQVETIVTKMHQVLKADFPRLLEGVDQLRSLVLGEYIWLHSVVFFACSSILSFFLTASRRTIGARCWIAVTLFVEFCLEISLLRLGASNELIYDSQWKLRKSVGGIMLLVLFAFFYSYRDINRENNQLLIELRSHIIAIRSQPQHSTSPPIGQGPCNEEHTSQLMTGDVLDTTISQGNLVTSDDSCCAAALSPRASASAPNEGLRVEFFMSEQEALRLDRSMMETQQPLANGTEPEGAAFNTLMSDETLSDASSSDGDDDDDASGDGSDNGINGTESESEEEEKWSDFESDAISTASYESSVSTEERVPDSTRRANSTNEHRSLNNQSTPTRRSCYNLRPRSSPRVGSLQSLSNPIISEETPGEFGDSISIQSKLVRQYYEKRRQAHSSQT
ncbi:uncharacterized protein LOC142340265 [Convolutriloba macropyga]|uniref:uncharacterized protein LOC142340265 n=1 Tax=Convolutriloba macropyga TaxID=536237 RepID=UPI003F51BC07